jgi:5'-methylthioinosine phosphorylase
MRRLGIIGGTALAQLQNLQTARRQTLTTPYGAPSADYVLAELNGIELVFLTRHGTHHTIPPHLINYRANIWGMQSLAVEGIIAFATVGGIGPGMFPGRLAVPDQLIDYSWGRPHTFFEKDFMLENHIDFTAPYDPALRQLLITAAGRAKLDIVEQGTYGVTQGPRLETAAEIRRMANDGCHLVGMTGMPEAVLARELSLPYACCAAVVNWAAGLSAEEITIEEIRRIALDASSRMQRWLEAVVGCLIP